MLPGYGNNTIAFKVVQLSRFEWLYFCAQEAYPVPCQVGWKGYKDASTPFKGHINGRHGMGANVVSVLRHTTL